MNLGKSATCSSPLPRVAPTQPFCLSAPSRVHCLAPPPLLRTSIPLPHPCCAPYCCRVPSHWAIWHPLVSHIGTPAFGVHMGKLYALAGFLSPLVAFSIASFFPSFPHPFSLSSIVERGVHSLWRHPTKKLNTCGSLLPKAFTVTLLEQPIAIVKGKAMDYS